jgi:hypothetical protein
MITDCHAGEDKADDTRYTKFAQEYRCQQYDKQYNRKNGHRIRQGKDDLQQTHAINLIKNKTAFNCLGYYYVTCKYAFGKFNVYGGRQK